jgi:hypothetical protein
LGRASLLTRRSLERALLTVGVGAFFLCGYFGVGRAVAPERALAFGTSLDGRIPFLARSVWIYLLVFPASLLPLFVVRSQRLFRLTILSYAAAISVSLVAFAAVPVTSAGLRVDSSRLDRSRPSSWAVSKLYEIDPPFNLFPSLHLSIAALAALAAWKAKPAYGAGALAGVALTAVAICTVKQHFVADAAGGALLAVACYASILRPYARGADGEPAYGWKGPAAFCGAVAAMYAGLYAWFSSSN